MKFIYKELSFELTTPVIIFILIHLLAILN